MQADEARRRAAKRRERARWRKTAGAVIAVTRRDNEKIRTQADLAHALGVSEDTVSAMEQGKRKIEVGDLVMVAKAFDVPVETLLRRIVGWSQP